MKKAIALALTTSAIAGCATTPDMDVGYYGAQASADFKAVETVTCDAGNHILGAVTGTIVPKFSANSTRHLVPIRRLDGALSDTDIAFDYYDDGRLKGLNSESTGQLEPVIKTAATVFASLIMGLDGGSSEFPVECGKIAQWGGDKKVLTLTWIGETQFTDESGTKIPLKPEQNSLVYSQVLAATGSICAVLGAATKPEPLANLKKGSGAAVTLAMVQPANVTAEIIKFKEPDCKGPPLSEPAVSMTVLVPQHGKPFALALPRAAMLGKNGIALSVSEAGTITKLKYGKTSGAPATANALGAVINAADETRAERITRLKEEADMIVAQERLVRCMAAPTDCK